MYRSRSEVQCRQSKFSLRGEIFSLTGRGMKLGRSPRPEGPRVGLGSWGGDSEPPPHQLEGLGSAVSSPSGVWTEPRKI